MPVRAQELPERQIRNENQETNSGFTTGPAIVAYLAAFKLALHLATAGVYGLFIDELYFLACGEHLAWGYVDMPPLTAFQAWLTRALFGNSMVSIRLFAALAGAGLILVTGAMVRELGGKRFAQALAAIAVLIAPGFLAFDSYLSMNSIEPLIWMGCALILIRIIKTGDPRRWVWFGLLAGVGLENKQTMALFGFGLVAGLVLTAERRLLMNRWFLLGGAIAFVIFLPNLIWNIQHHFPLMELLANIRRNGRDIVPGPLRYIWIQILFSPPTAAPIWMVGLWRLLISRDGRSYRLLGWAYLAMLAVLLVTHGKIYYLAPVYPMLMAPGAVAIEKWLEFGRLRWLRPAYASLLILTGIWIAPTVMPILPPDTYLWYTKTFHIEQPRFERRATNAMPQFFADRFGWPEMVEAVAKVYNRLPPEERARTAIFGNDFGETGAIDFYGPQFGLPKSIGNHLSNWDWGPRSYTGEIVIVLGGRREGEERHFESVEAVGEIGHPYAMKQEHFTLFLCRKPRGWTLQQIWPQLKNWN
ncbi:MAG: glycosyltransferase family 39 protein [Acidobacteriia bacterium]|nr:glycosyltransferase family 39 protein [Terriglobia bacterium]